MKLYLVRKVWTNHFLWKKHKMTRLNGNFSKTEYFMTFDFFFLVDFTTLDKLNFTQLNLRKGINRDLDKIVVLQNFPIHKM